MFKKVLIANRGEIAVRVERALREMGIKSVAVYSDVDRASLHVRKADEAYHIGPPLAAESYLNIPKLIAIAKKCGAEAIHPGYGFLSENPKFERACREAGLKFIGPPAEAMEAMGSKTKARQAMEKAGVPFVPGSAKGLASLKEAEEMAEKIGYPIMLKAAAGGGGKGMRMVTRPNELKSAFEGAQSEALRSFGDDEVYIEKFIVEPRHIEMQILADEHGNCVWLGERECSVQRRHQKVLEECPSPLADEQMRRKMGEIAVRAAKACGYTSAGTVEFLSDQNKNFYFLEMNTRLQVEHPVTEMVTGLDLVHLQLHIAAGEKLPFRQEDINLRGHAIECRIYAEDPDNNYFPSPGKINLLMMPSGPGIRRDSGMYEGWTVPVEYDPLLAKLITYGSTREQAIQRLRRALDEYFVGGIKTNISLFKRIVEDRDFHAGKLDTGFLDRLLARAPAATQTDEEGMQMVAIAAGLFSAIAPAASGAPAEDAANGAVKNGAGARPPVSPWKEAARLDALRPR
ncbi:MAG: acetyl-CoA carboxylase biotin carboxylase subunit [Terriglobales bacterium]